MGRHAEQITTDLYTPRRSSRQYSRTPVAPKAAFSLTALLLFIAAFVPMLIIPLQHANQALAHGSIKTATVTSSEIIKYPRSDTSQRIAYYFKNDDGETVFGVTSRTKPQSTDELERWSSGKQVRVHYVSDKNYVVDDVLPGRFYILIWTFIFGFPALLMGALKSISEVRIRSEAERVILNPKPGSSTIHFNHETNRSELPADRASGLMTESYRSLTSFQHGFKFHFFGTFAFILAAVSTMFVLSLLTLSQPTHDAHVLVLSVSLLVASAVCCFSCALCHRAYLTELGPERETEIARRRQLLEDHRRKVKE